MNYFRKEHKISNNILADKLEKEPFVPPIYNYVSSSVNPLTWGEFSSYNKKYGYEVPSVKAVGDFIRFKPNNEYIIIQFIV